MTTYYVNHKGIIATTPWDDGINSNFFSHYINAQAFSNSVLQGIINKMEKELQLLQKELDSLKESAREIPSESDFDIYWTPYNNSPTIWHTLLEK